jgi:hypothetical protein
VEYTKRVKPVFESMDQPTPTKRKTRRRRRGPNRERDKGETT